MGQVESRIREKVRMELFEVFEEFDFFFEVGFGGFGFGGRGLIFIFGGGVAEELSVTGGVFVFHGGVVGDGGFGCESFLPFALFEFIFEGVVFGRSYVWEHA